MNFDLSPKNTNILSVLHTFCRSAKHFNLDMSVSMCKKIQLYEGNTVW